MSPRLLVFCRGTMRLASALSRLPFAAKRTKGELYA
jgi:hypothetical protein